MAFKVFVLLVATVLLVEGRTLNKRATFDLSQFVGSSANPTEAAQTIIIAGATEIISVTDKAKTTLIGFIDVAKTTQARIETQAQAEIDSIVKNAEAKAATQTGDQACITMIIGKVKALGASTLLNVAKCLLDKVTALETLLAKVVSTADMAITMAPAAALELDACKTQGIFKVPCEAVAAFKFVGKVNTVVSDTAKIVTTATTMYASLTTDLSTCAAGKVVELTASATKLVAELAYCEVKAKLTG